MKIILRYTYILLFATIAAGLWQACKDEEPTVANPTVSSFTPSAGGPAGTLVSISGSYYSTTKPTVVKFNGVKAETLDVGPSSITAIVPAGASTGKISVEIEGRSGNSSTDFAVTTGTPAPAIVSFTPTTGNGADATEVTINGVNLTKTPVVKFNGVTITAPVVSNSDNDRSITVKVPKGATTGKITVEAGGQTGTSAGDFGVPVPTVTGFTPKTSIVGSTVVITGTNFSKTAANNVVNFGSVSAAVPSEASTTSLTVIVPVGATNGKISVTVDGQKGESADEFKIN